MRLGLLARCDIRGGLANQTAEFYRHMAPERTLVVHTAHLSRGECDASRYDGTGLTWLPGSPSVDDAGRFMDGLDVVFSCECLYLPTWMQGAKAMGVDVVVQANPELYDARELAGARIVLPTSWESHRIPHERILPVPIALDRFPYRQRTEARVFYHPTATAMMDRNGTGIVLAALQHVTAEVTVIIRGQLSRGDIARKRERKLPANVTLIEMPWTDGPYWESYPDADVLLLPRRYGGLCLPMQEAAALGMPVITTDLPPQREYPHAVLVDATPSTREHAKGGELMVYKADPRAVAREIDRLAGAPEQVADLSMWAREWAESLGWDRWASEYASTLDSPLRPS